MGRGQSIQYHKPIHEDYVDGSLTCLKPEIIKKHINNHFPLVLNIEPTNACNLSCTFCPREKTVQQQGTNYLSMKTFKKIIDEINEDNRLIMLNLHKDGEPLLNKELPEMVAYAKEKNIAKVIHLNTNGTLLNTPRGKQLLEAGIDDITISIDAAFAETYQKLKQRRGFNVLNDNIQSFIEYRDKIGAITTIRVKIMEFNQINDDEIEAFHDRWEGIADQVQVTGVHDWNGAINNLTVTDETSPYRYPCALLWYALAINSNGDVSTCNVDWNYSGVVGNIHKKCLRSIWQDLPIRKIRQAHLNSQWNYVPVCNKCVVWVSVGDMKEYLETRLEFI